MTLLESFRDGYQQGLTKAAPPQTGRKRKPKPGTKPRPRKPRIGGLILLGLAVVLLACPWLLILGLAFLPRGGNWAKRGLMRMGGDIDRDRS